LVIERGGACVPAEVVQLIERIGWAVVDADGGTEHQPPGS
jgi:hypothetical protein